MQCASYDAATTRSRLAALYNVGLENIELSASCSAYRRRLTTPWWQRDSVHRLLQSAGAHVVQVIVTICDRRPPSIAAPAPTWSYGLIANNIATISNDTISSALGVSVTAQAVRQTMVDVDYQAACPPGYFSRVGECVLCRPGSFSNETGRSGCTECTAGTYQKQAGATSCEVCGAGNYSANILSCEPCQWGEFCAVDAQVGTRCPLAHSTTRGRGAADVTDCVCQSGHYLRAGGDACTPCPYGTNCSKLGVTVASLPVLAHFWRLPNSTVLRRCLGISNCTGGSDALELCGSGYEGVFCAVCSKDYNGTHYHRSVGMCEPCEASIVPAVGATLVGVLVLCLLTLALKRSERTQRILRTSRLHAVAVMGAAEKEHDEECEADFELPDVNLGAIKETLRLRFPDVSWPELPNIGLLELPNLPRLALSELALRYPQLAPWPSAPNLAFLCNVLRIALPDLAWPDTPDPNLPEWEWLGCQLPDLDLSPSLFDSVLVKFRILISMIQVRAKLATLCHQHCPHPLACFAQVLSQLGVVYSIPFPNVYAALLRWMGLIEFNLPEVLPFGCLISFTFYSGLLLRTLMLPGLGLLFVVACTLLGQGFGHSSRPSLPGKEQKAVDSLSGTLFVILFLIYPSTSAAIFATFQCEELEDGTSWLLADPSIDCQSRTHTFFWGYALLMVVVYPIGTPILYLVLLWRHKPRLDKLRANQELRIKLLEEVRANRNYEASCVSPDSSRMPWLVSKAECANLPIDVRHRLRQLKREELKERKLLPGCVAKLVKGYKVRMWWFEIFGCFHKLTVACLPVFFRYAGSAEQLMYGLLACFICFGVFVHFDPYEDRFNGAIAQLCQVFECATIPALSLAIATPRRLLQPPSPALKACVMTPNIAIMIMLAHA